MEPFDRTPAEPRREAALQSLTGDLTKFERRVAAVALAEVSVDALEGAAAAPAPERWTRLVVWFASAAGEATGEDLRHRLNLVGTFGARGGSLAAAWPVVLRLLDDPDAAMSAGRLVRSVAWDAPPAGATARLAELLDRDGHIAHACACALGTLALADGDLPTLCRLLGHANSPVREGAAYAVHVAFLQGRSVAFAVPVLAASLADPSGAVLWHAIQALDHAFKQGVDLTAALPGLDAAVARTTWPEDGWVFGRVQTTDEGAVGDYPPGRQAAHLAAVQRARACAR